MRVLFFHADTGWSGGARVFAAAARGLAARGHTVGVACPSGSALERYLDFSSCRLFSTPARPDGVRGIPGLRRAVVEHAANVIFVHTAPEQGVAAAAAKLGGGRCAVLRRISESHRDPARRDAWSEQAALRLARTRYLYTSTAAAANNRSARGASFPAAVVPLGVDVDAQRAMRAPPRATLELPAAARVLLCLAPGGDRTRLAHAVRALALLVPRHPDLHLLLVGWGSDDAEVRMHAAALHVTGHVHFLGACDEYRPLLPLAEIGWSLGRGEEGEFATLDLLAAGVPVLAERDSVAARHLPDGIAGVILPPGDAHAAAAAIARLLANAWERSAMGEAGRARVLREHAEAAMVIAFEGATAGTESGWR